MKPNVTSAGLLASGAFMLLFGALTPQAPGQTTQARLSEKFGVVGYLPDSRIASIDPDMAKNLTDLIYFAAVEPGTTGEANLDRIKPETLRLLSKIKTKHGIRVHLGMGGASRSKAFPALAASPAARNRFVEEVTKFCRDHSFDGFDLDWEHPTSPTELQDHALLLSALKMSFQPHRLRLTLAAAGWQKLLPEAIAAVDGVHLMSYDAKGRHSTYELAQMDIARMTQRGVPLDKLYLGVPFYGRAIETPEKAMTYAEIMRRYHPAASADEVNGIFFNGSKMIERKTELALMSKLAGVMVWEVGQDSKDETGLLPVIHRTVEGSKLKR